MLATNSGTPDPLPRRDYLLLPLTVLLTLALLLLASESAARHFYPDSEADTCEVPDATVGINHRPNCTSRLKTSESPWVINQYNECGYRTHESCRAKPAGAIRIALIGSSVSEGLFIPYDQTFAVRTATALSQQLGRPVEVQNLGVKGCYPVCTYHRVDEALALKPDILLMTITPYDIEHLVPADVAHRHQPLAPEQVGAPGKLTPFKRLQTELVGSSAVKMTEHFLFEDPATYMSAFLVYGDKADFLRQPFTPAWEDRFQALDLLLGEMAAKSRAANVPFVLMEEPSVAQASALALHPPPAGIDPAALNTRLQQIATQHGIQFVNVLDAFSHTARPAQFFYVIDGHVNGDGQALISQQLTQQLLAQQSAALNPSPKEAKKP
jgi:hypothetical protein